MITPWKPHTKERFYFLVLNDLSYLLRKRMIFVFMLTLLPLFIFLLLLPDNPSIMEIFHNGLGTNLELQSLDFFQLIIYLFQMAIFLFFTFDLLLKDLKSQIDLIFLRMRPTRWIVVKLSFLTCFFTLLKIIQYGLLLFFIGGSYDWSSQVVLLFFSDLLYGLFLSWIAFLIYLLVSIYSRWRWASIGLGLWFLYAFPKSIWSLSSYLYLFIPLILITLFLIYLIFKKQTRKIFQNVRSI